MPGAPARCRSFTGPAGRPHGSRRRAALLVTALLGPVLAGCTGTPDAAEGSAAAGSVAVASRAALTRGGSVTWGVDALPDSLNAFHEAAGPVTAQVAGAVLPMLFTLDEQGRPRLNADYLRSAEITEREPRQTVVYTLHPKARWSDGKPLAAADFESQWRALNGEDDAFEAARAAGYDRIESVTEGPGARQVTVTFAEPYADWRSLFSPLYPRSVTGDPDRFNGSGAGDGARPPASGGPFAVAGVDRETGTITLARNGAWWGEPALLDELVLAAVPRGERREALLAGELDLAEIPATDAEQITAAHDDGQGAPGAPGPEAGTGNGDLAATVAAMHDWATARLADADAPRTTEAHQRYARTLAAAERAREATFAEREAALRQRLRDLTVYRAYDAGYTQLTLNGAAPALADERVRWALARALDREALAEDVHGPAGLPAAPLGSHLWTPGQPGYQDNSEALGRTGKGAAVSLLEDAGWRLSGAETDTDGKPGTPERAARAETRATPVTPDGDNGANDGAPDSDQARAVEPARPAAPAVRTRNGKSLELSLLVPTAPGSGHLSTTGRGIVATLGEVGVRADLTEVPADEFFAERLPGGDFDLALFSWPATAFPATDAQPLFAKPQALPGGEMLIGQNYTRLGTDYIDQLLRQASGELDGEEHAELLNKADARLWQVAGSVPLYQPPQLVAARSDLAGVGAHGLATPRYQDIGFRR